MERRLSAIVRLGPGVRDSIPAHNPRTRSRVWAFHAVRPYGQPKHGALRFTKVHRTCGPRQRTPHPTTSATPSMMIWEGRPQATRVPNRSEEAWLTPPLLNTLCRQWWPVNNTQRRSGHSRRLPLGRGGGGGGVPTRASKEGVACTRGRQRVMQRIREQRNSAQADKEGWVWKGSFTHSSGCCFCAERGGGERNTEQSPRWQGPQRRLCGVPFDTADAVRRSQPARKVKCGSRNQAAAFARAPRRASSGPRWPDTRNTSNVFVDGRAEAISGSTGSDPGDNRTAAR